MMNPDGQVYSHEEWEAKLAERMASEPPAARVGYEEVFAADAARLEGYLAGQAEALAGPNDPEVAERANHFAEMVGRGEPDAAFGPIERRRLALAASREALAHAAPRRARG